jgi:hypothetical protein
MVTDSDFEMRVINREVTAWGGLAHFKRMHNVIGFCMAARSWDLPQPGSNLGYPPIQIVEMDNLGLCMKSPLPRSMISIV